MTATISMAVANGLGRLQSSLSNHQITALQKVITPPFCDFKRCNCIKQFNPASQRRNSHFKQYGYASQLLYIPALCLTKLTTLVYLRALSPESRFGIMNKLLECFIIIWGLGVEFAIAFQCQLPSPWAIISGKCFNTVNLSSHTPIYDS